MKLNRVREGRCVVGGSGRGSKISEYMVVPVAALDASFEIEREKLTKG